MKCIVCKKEIEKSYGAAGLYGTYCLECATNLGFVDKSVKNDFKEGFKEGLAQKQFDKDAEIMQLQQQLKKVQSIKEYRVNKLLIKNKKLKQQLALTQKALELACETSNYWWKANNGSKGSTLKDYSVNEFLTNAKEIMESE